MKKVININFQGRVIPIEETAFETLKQYSDSLRVYFANEEGRDEIINDIENRIAELFEEKIKKGATCITDEEVNSVINSMGRPADFDEIGGAETSTSASSAGTGSQSYSSAEEIKQPRRLSRSSNDKIIGGVCAGLAHYLRIDPAVMRILFAVITFGGFGAGFLLYIVLWIVLPLSELDSSTVLRKRLYRNPDDKVIGGVASGIAAYFNIEVWIPRIIFALPFILGAFSSVFNNHWWGPGPVIFSGGFGGTLFVTYIVLWIVLPLANTAAEKLEMRGEKVDLQSIKNTVKEELQSVKGRAEKAGAEFKEKAQEWGKEATDKGKAFAAEAAPVARKTGHGIGHAIGVLFKAFFLFIAGIIVFALFMALIGVLVAMIGAAPFTGFFFEGTWQNVLAWGTLLLFIGVPLVALVVWLVRRIAGIRSKKSYLGYVFGTLWTLGWVCAILFVASVSKDFKNQTPVTEEIKIEQPATGVLKVKAQSDKVRYYDRSWWWNDDDDRDAFFLNSNEDSMFLNTVRVKVVKSEDSLFHVHLVKLSRGYTPSKAETKAKNISFTVKQVDSILILPKGFTISQNDKYRAQRVMVIIEVPNGKKVILDRSIDSYDWFDVSYNRRGLGWTVDWNDNWERGYSWDSNVEYQMTEDGLKRTDKKDLKIKSGKFKIDENGVEGEINVEDNDDGNNNNTNKGEPTYRYKKNGDSIKIIPVKPATPAAPEKKEEKKSNTTEASTESLFPFTKLIDVI
ncbi:MAG: PspC domain-containing protein [Sphingobacteriales bacterium]|nr:PspC domain-containing protein [Sphingobacteriales bacterium]